MQTKDKKKAAILIFVTLFTVILGVVVVVTSFRLRELATVPVAPTAPQSIPQAAPIPGAVCSQEFTIAQNSCGEICYQDSDCRPLNTEATICIQADESETGICGLPSLQESCLEIGDYSACCSPLIPSPTPIPSVSPSVTPSPTPTPQPNQCGFTPCNTDIDCEGSLICITADDDTQICGMTQYQEACIADPGFEACCAPPPTPTPTNTPTPRATATPTPTPTTAPSPTPIIGCNDSCTSDSQCGSGMVCHQGTCRNPSCTQETDCACPAPTATPMPSLPEAGTTTPTYMILSIGLAIIILGAIGLLAW